MPAVLQARLSLARARLERSSAKRRYLLQPEPVRHTPNPILRMAALILIGTIAFFSVRIGWEWRTAVDNVDSMIVASVVLPTTAPTLSPGETPQPVSAIAATVVPPIPTLVPGSDEPVNILLLGSDARPGDEIARTDAIILVHLNPRTQRTSMLSFPRDLWVDVPGYGKNKLNAAYSIGEKQLGPGYGAALMKETISQIVGVPVHRFMLVNFDGFKQVIDIVGGITIDVPQAFEDPRYPVDAFPGDTRTMAVAFDAGIQTMDGERALIYARTRHADNDFGRNRRQQQVLKAIFDQVRAKGLLAQITSLDDYTAAMRDSLRTDIPRDEMLRLAEVGTRVDLANAQSYAIDAKRIIVQSDPSRFTADPVAVRELVDQMTAAAGLPSE